MFGIDLLRYLVALLLSLGKVPLKAGLPRIPLPKGPAPRVPPTPTDPIPIPKGPFPNPGPPPQLPIPNLPLPLELLLSLLAFESGGATDVLRKFILEWQAKEAVAETAIAAGSKKLMKVQAAYDVVDAWVNRFGLWIVVPPPVLTILVRHFKHELAKKALPQTGHTVRRRITQGKRGRPKKGTPAVVRQYLRI